MEPTNAEHRIEIQHNDRSDWGRGEWISEMTSFAEGATIGPPAVRGHGKRFEDALLGLAPRIPGWGEPAITYDGATELPRIGIIMQAHKDWTLSVHSLDGKTWTASFNQRDVVLGAFTHERPYEAIARAFDLALQKGGGAQWGNVAMAPTDT